MNRRSVFLLGCLIIVATSATSRAQIASYDQPPIQYSTTQPHDPVSRLAQRMRDGTAKLERSASYGYLESLLRELKISASSQTLVFSRTSFQRDLISPKNPRALYFDDETYVGYVPGGEVLEIATTDPALGTIFYTIKQPAVGDDAGKLLRQTENCLACHGESMTHDVPGLLVRSTFCDADGMPILSAGTFLTTHESPLSERWGGWYVSGARGTNAGMGNALFAGQEGQSNAKPLRAAELKDASSYLSPRSDPVALLVLAHQVEAHNRFTRAAYAARLALRDEKVLSDALGEKPSPGVHSESTLHRVAGACDPLLQYLLFSGEAAMTQATFDAASSKFALDFAARGPRDSHGRSLREFDLKMRLFKYPCSYLFYSPSFDELPDVAKDYLYHRLFVVLSGKDTSKEFAHLSTADRKAILDILRETKSGLPEYWKTK